MPIWGVLIGSSGGYYFTMITQDKYIIIDSIPEENLKEKLCIINFDIISNEKELRVFIKNNNDVTFWCTTRDFSRLYIETASKLGIQNVIESPIQTQLIENFFDKNTESSGEDFYEYDKLENSNLLIVDDNELNISLLEDILDNLGINIYSFQNPLSVIDKLDDIPFNLCLLDILMPEMSGFELAKKIKSSNLNRNTPIVFISAVSGDETVFNGYNLGASSYIEKPFSPRIVKAQIYNILKMQERDKLRTKENDNFVAALTHDLKSPINAEILAIRYMLNNLSENVNSVQNEILSELLNSAQYMKLITDKILCHYKQKNSNIILNKEKIKFSSVILSGIDEMRYLTGDKDIQIRFFDDSANDIIEADYIEIKRVINNLISNAIEYSPVGSDIDIRLYNNSENVFCEIKDYGAGINLEKYGNIFDEYITLSKEQKKIGFGLGLHICRSIILAHGGNITISSKPQRGTTISFNIPLFSTIETVKVEE